MPNDGIKIIKTNAPADDANIGMKRKHKVASKVAASYADVADDAYKATTGNENTECVSPYFFQLGKECLVVLDMTELIRVLVIALEIPIGRRCDNKMYRLIL